MINSYHIEIRSLRLIWVDFVNKSEIKRLPKLTAFYVRNNFIMISIH